MVDRILMELYDDYSEGNVDSLIEFAYKTFSFEGARDLFVGCTLILFSKTGPFKPRYDCTREKLLSIVLLAKEKIGSTNLLAFYVDRINKVSGIHKYLDNVLRNNTEKSADLVVEYLEKFKPCFSLKLKQYYSDKIKEYIDNEGVNDEY